MNDVKPAADASQPNLKWGSKKGKTCKSGGDGIEIEEIPYNTWKATIQLSLNRENKVYLWNLEVSLSLVVLLLKLSIKHVQKLIHIFTRLKLLLMGIGFIGIGFQPKLI